jgi:hypothetical protein
MFYRFEIIIRYSGWLINIVVMAHAFGIPTAKLAQENSAKEKWSLWQARFEIT